MTQPHPTTHTPQKHNSIHPLIIPHIHTSSPSHLYSPKYSISLFSITLLLPPFPLSTTACTYTFSHVPQLSLGASLAASNTAFTASVAKPRPHATGRNRYPISMVRTVGLGERVEGGKRWFASGREVGRRDLRVIIPTNRKESSSSRSSGSDLGSISWIA